MAVKIVETCTYALPPVLRFTTLGVLHECMGGCILLVFSLFLQLGKTYILAEVYQSYLCNVCMFVFRFFPYLVFMRIFLDWQLLE